MGSGENQMPIIWRILAAVVLCAYILRGLLPSLPDETDWERRAAAPVVATMIQPPSSMYSISRQLEGQLSTESLSMFNENLRRFTARMHQAGSDSEVGATLSEVAKLMMAPVAVATAQQRLQLVQEIVAQCAEPHVIKQGHHNTCAIAALESRLYTRSPSVPARIVAQVAIAGRFGLRDGMMITVPQRALQPDAEAQLYSPRNERRTYASQLFQIAGANAYWQSRTEDPRGIKVPLGSISYLQYSAPDENADDTGERLVINRPDGSKENVLASDGKIDYSPSFGLSQILDLNSLLSAERDQDFIVAASATGGDSRILQVHSISSLRQTLAKLAKGGHLPVILSVNLNSGVFGADQVRARDGHADWHAVNVSDYDASTATVTIDNWWSDRLPLRNYNTLSVADLFPAMCDRAPASVAASNDEPESTM